MNFPWQLRRRFACAIAATCLAPWALAASDCRPGCPGPASEPRLLGIDYAGSRLADLDRLRREDLTGALKMSGTWVSKLTFDPFVRIAVQFCRYANDRGQDAYIQLPVTLTSREASAALEALAAQGCQPKGFAIGNEVDRMVTEKIVARYTPADYIADYNRIVPLVTRRFPAARIIVLELASFTVKEYADGDPDTVKYRPVFEWLLPFLKASLVRRPDFVSVHYYPFTGAQKEWETLSGLRMLRKILSDLAPYLANAPPLLIGEFNTTYQYEADTVYPASGGDSFMAALLVPGLVHNGAIAGLFHWSLSEPAHSTLGLFQGRTVDAAPLYHAYRMMAGVQDHQLAVAHVARPGVEAYAFHKQGRFRTFAVNTSPFFVRNAEVRVDFCGCAGAAKVATLPPLSITEFAGDATRRFSRSDRTIRSGDVSDAERSTPHCAPLADFSQKRFAAAHFENARFNQNGKIGTGGTFVPVSSSGARATLRAGSDHLAVDCKVPEASSRYFQCGVKLPLVPDAAADRKQGVDWSEGFEMGSFRVTLDADVPVAIDLFLEDHAPEAVGNNPHLAKVQLSGRKTLSVPIRQFSQSPGFGIARHLKDVLRNAAAVRIETRQPGFSGQFRIHQLEVCDVP